MRRVTVKSLNTSNGDIKDGSTIMVATLDNGALAVSGDVPASLSDVNMETLAGKDAEDMFYILAGSPQSTYSRTSFEGTDREDIINYLKNVFSKKDLERINPYFINR